MTPLADLLIRRISKTGPISIADYMTECLLHPKHGYYTTRDPLGQAGDFITAPEISQMFGELIGLFLAQVWLEQGMPDRFTLAEAGPGRGTLMADILRATRGVPGFHAAADIRLIEASPTLRTAQRDRLADYDVSWCDSIGDLPDAPTYFVANEFFDALPIRQFQRDPNGWREVQVGLDGDRLVLGLSAPAPISALDHRLNDTSEGEIVELCPSAAPLAEDIAARIANHGGVGLIIDYGGWHSRGDTFQALRNHSPEGVLDTPGAADLTAHVDFEVLAKAAKAAGARASGMTPQGVFLERLGITHRAQSLAKGLDGARLEAHIAAHRRLTHGAEMGTLFKSLAITPQGAPLPPGLDE